ncbi:MAG: hypothetical protein SFX74_13295 [Fimbriimonadaceae bacterium]|nr:hypothetical protein [Fimbriimonadaceae bacterium]
MNRKLAITPLLVSLGIFVSAQAHAPTEVLFRLKWKAGDRLRYFITARANAPMFGLKLPFVLKSIERLDVKAIGSDGSRTIRVTPEVVDMEVNGTGDARDAVKLHKPYEFEVSETGEVLSEFEINDADGEVSLAIMILLPQLAELPIEIGKPHRFTRGEAEEKCEITLLYAADEDVEGIPCRKLNITLRDEDPNGGNGKFTYWLSRADSSVVNANGTINLMDKEGPTRMDLTVRRL